MEGGLVERAGSVGAESVRSGRVLHGRTVCQGQAGSVMKKSVREGQGLLAKGRDFRRTESLWRAGPSEVGVAYHDGRSLEYGQAVRSGGGGVFVEGGAFRDGRGLSW